MLQQHQTVLQEMICPGVVGGTLDFPRSASFASVKIVQWSGANLINQCASKIINIFVFMSMSKVGRRIFCSVQKVQRSIAFESGFGRDGRKSHRENI